MSSDDSRRSRRHFAAVIGITGFLLAVFPTLASAGAVSGTVAVTPPKYLAETVVYVVSTSEKVEPKAATMDQSGMKFVPHILIVAKGDTVKFLNHDAVAHNVFTSDFEAYNLGQFKKGEERTHVFAQNTGVYTQLCSIHPEMLGFIFVGQNRHAAVVDEKGSFTLKDVPAGTYKLAVWNSHFKAPEQSITVTASGTTEANFALHR